MVVRAMRAERAVEGVGAAEAWRLYGSIRLSQVVARSLPELISRIEVVRLEGEEGGAGTVLQLFFVDEALMSPYKEKFTLVDDARRVKETEVVEGGYLDLGFSLYRVRFELIDGGGGGDVNSSSSCCTVRTTVEYEVKEGCDEETAAKLVSMEPLLEVMRVASDHLLAAAAPPPHDESQS
ncbi:norbelladine synthase-like [Andrographis paniculata]|uniref:norbelladine synthase-like n=1 Tax=Andrographis paniculata TaxID=175694 RepID=UPI0021E8260C|nr:norbelladine synthase-like [Andrographis paniculata]XP_051134075.1 norbelladine synthase-like [Andrographis paniculata]